MNTVIVVAGLVFLLMVVVLALVIGVRAHGERRRFASTEHRIGQIAVEANRRHERAYGRPSTELTRLHPAGRK